MGLLRKEQGNCPFGLNKAVAKDMGQIQPRKEEVSLSYFIEKSSKLGRIVLKQSALEKSESSRWPFSLAGLCEGTPGFF